MWREAVPWLLGSAPAAPALAAAVLGITWLWGAEWRERVVANVAVAASSWTALATLLGVAAGLIADVFPLELGPVPWFGVGDYTFSLAFRWDTVSLVMICGVAVLGGLVTGFSKDYLHRERGALRYYVLLLLFSAAMQWLVLSASFDQLFLGWEVVGLTSILLVAFFSERAQPVHAAIRVLIAYRVCDLGLLVGAVLMHQLAGTTEFSELHAGRLGAGGATALGLLLLLAASGKAAQLPFGVWLPRAMEGPTPSSALFYGGLSVHAGIYLLIRAAPVFEASPAASAAAIAVGGVTAAAGGLLSRVQADAKTALAWASMSQLGLMVVEVGLHLPLVALAHLVGHASLRTVQLLKAPSLLADSVALRQALGAPTLRLESRDVSPGVFRTLRTGLFLDVLLERLVVRPLVNLGVQLERLGGRASPSFEKAEPPRDAGARQGAPR